VTSELNCKVDEDDDDGVSCLNEEVGNRSITLVFIATFGVELWTRKGDDFDKEVLNDSVRVVMNSTFRNDLACGDAKDGISCFGNEAVNGPIMVVLNSVVGNG